MTNLKMIETYEEFLKRWKSWCAASEPSDATKADALAWVLEYPNIGLAEEVAAIWRTM